MLKIVSKILKAYREGRLIPALKSGINPYLKGLKYVVYDPASNNVVLHSPDYTFHSELTNYQEIMNNPETLILFGLPVYYVIGTALFMIFLFFMSEPLYRLDIKLGYGKILKKLEELLEDMEELRK